MKGITIALVEAGHQIACLGTFAPALTVERGTNIFVVTIAISVGVIPWTTTFCLFNMHQPIPHADIEARQVITSWTERPDIIAGGRK